MLRLKKYSLLFAFVFFFLNCTNRNIESDSSSIIDNGIIADADLWSLSPSASLRINSVEATESELTILKCNPQLANLVNIRDLDTTILVSLKYATTNNFTGMILYDDIDGAYLQPDVALMLVEAQRYLNTLQTDGLRLLVYDAARPLSVQRIMWNLIKDTRFHRYVSNPDERLSLHNFGAAVDLTIANSAGQPLDMGTDFDHFGRASGITNEEGLIEQGLLTRQHVQNRELLRRVMRHAGFRPICGEWWHFNACSRQEAMQRYELIE